MLGLADRGRIFDLLEKLLGGATAEAIEAFARLHRDGAEPGQVLADLAEAVHIATRAKTLGQQRPARVSRRGKAPRRALAERLSVAILARAWQMLLKGLEEVAAAPNQAAAAEMVLIRLAFTADLPAPDDIIKALGGQRRRPGAAAEHAGRARAAAAGLGKLARCSETSRRTRDGWRRAIGSPSRVRRAALPMLRSFADVVATGRRAPRGQAQGASGRAREPGELRPRRQHRAASAARRAEGAANELREKLNPWTGKRWMVALSKTPGERPSAKCARERAAAECANSQASRGGGRAAAVSRCRDYQRAAAVRASRPMTPAPASRQR